MIQQLSDLFPFILVSASGALFFSPMAVKLARRLGLVDMPGSAPHKSHASPTPLAGGVVILAALSVAYILLPAPVDRSVMGLLIGSSFMLLLGLLDDRFGISVLIKLAGQILITTILVIAGIQVHITQIPWVDLLITYIWVVGLANAFNFVDSMDGLALGLAGIAAAFFMLATIDSAQPELSALSAGVMGAAVGGYFLSAAPAKMFLGDSGAQMLGYLLAGIGIAYTPAQAGLPQAVSWFTPILVLGVPIFDMFLVVFSRIRRRSPIYQAGHDHTYHRLARIWFDPSRAVLAMQISAILLGLIGFILLQASPLVANLAFAIVLIAAALGVVILEKPHREDNRAP
jgi:UDP-GlcNAc:undecaprenyl-phosphate GlcNAc-1-phosphate transferase